MQSGNRRTLAALVWNPIAVATATAPMTPKICMEDRHSMTTKSRNKPAGKSVNSGAQQPAKSKKPAFVSRYLGIDSHLTERNGSTDQVYGIAGERPAGRKLAEDIAKHCIQLDAEGYEVVSIFPLTSGRAVEASVEAAEQVHGRTYTERVEVEKDDSTPSWYGTRYEDKHYVDTGVGYSVTDGVIITAKLRK